LCLGCFSSLDRNVARGRTHAHTTPSWLYSCMRDACYTPTTSMQGVNPLCSTAAVGDMFAGSFNRHRCWRRSIHTPTRTAYSRLQATLFHAAGALTTNVFRHLCARTFSPPTRHPRATRMPRLYRLALCGSWTPCLPPHVAVAPAWWPLQRATFLADYPSSRHSACWTEHAPVARCPLHATCARWAHVTARAARCTFTHTRCALHSWANNQDACRSWRTRARIHCGSLFAGGHGPLPPSPPLRCTAWTMYAWYGGCFLLV